MKYIHKTKWMILFAFLSGSIGSSCLGQSDKKVAIMTEEFIFDQAEFAECHASSIVELEDGRLMATWFGGPYERHPEVAIWTSIRSEDSWSTPVKVADGKVNDTLSYPTWNPVLFKDTDNKLFLFYKEGPSPQEWWGKYKTSDDGGKTWSVAIQLPEGILGPIKNKPISLSDGTLLSPSSIEVDETNWKAHIEISKDHGKTWKKVAIDPEGEFDVIQPSILTHEDGRLQVLCRSRQNHVVTAWSSDRGESWGPLEKTDVLNPNSGTDAVTLSNGKHLLVYNPAVSGGNWWEGRHTLKVACSEDGVHWEDVCTLEQEEEGEFSYPAIIQSSDGSIHITYTWKRKKIKYVRLRIK